MSKEEKDGESEKPKGFEKFLRKTRRGPAKKDEDGTQNLLIHFSKSQSFQDRKELLVLLNISQTNQHLKARKNY